MSERIVFSRNQLLSELKKSVHGDLASYAPVARLAAKHEPEFLAHTIAWDALKGQINDSKVALPVISLASPEFPEDFVDNSLAHIVKLEPRFILRALRFAEQMKTPGRRRSIKRAIHRWVSYIESNSKLFDAIAVQHRNTLREIYAINGIRPSSDRVRAILFGKDEKGNKLSLPSNTVFSAIHDLKAMDAKEAAGAILKYKIPTLVIMGALGDRLKKDTDIAMALIDSMSPTEIQTNMKMLEKMGVTSNPVLKAALDEALRRVVTSKKTTLKTSRAIDAVKDAGLKEKLRSVQEKQIQNSKGIEGNWLILGDRSGSMQAAIVTSQMVSAGLAKFVKGQVHLIFFNNSPTYFEVSGMDYDHIEKLTRHVVAGGGTSIGCGLQYAVDNGLEIDGVAVISDGGENAMPRFADVYTRLIQKLGKVIPVYFYHLNGDGDSFTTSMTAQGHAIEEFDMRGKAIDYYSIPNLVASMRANRWSLADEILETPLLTLDAVLGEEKRLVTA